jgi:hypothetical protein
MVAVVVKKDNAEHIALNFGKMQNCKSHTKLSAILILVWSMFLRNQHFTAFTFKAFKQLRYPFFAVRQARKHLLIYPTFHSFDIF